jgi:hypothetical protein
MFSSNQQNSNNQIPAMSKRENKSEVRKKLAEMSLSTPLLASLSQFLTNISSSSITVPSSTFSLYFLVCHSSFSSSQQLFIVTPQYATITVPSLQTLTIPLYFAAILHYFWLYVAGFGELSYEVVAGDGASALHIVQVLQHRTFAPNNKWIEVYSLEARKH